MPEQAYRSTPPRRTRLAALSAAALLAVLLAVVLTAPPALACQDDLKDAMGLLKLVQEHAGEAPPKQQQRVQKLIEDAVKALADARNDCAAADNSMERRMASTKVAGVRKLLTDAAALITQR